MSFIEFINFNSNYGIEQIQTYNICIGFLFQIIPNLFSYDLYACGYQTQLNFDLTNQMDYHDSALQLHLVKIVDRKTDVRSLIEGITNNKTSVTEKNEEVKKDNLRGNLKNGKYTDVDSEGDKEKKSPVWFYFCFRSC